MNGHDVSILSEEASLSGRISAHDLTVLGGFEGNLTVRGCLRIGPKGKVKANVNAETVEVEGAFEGEIRARVLSFMPSARARGMFLADRLGINDGAIVEGSFNLPGKTDARVEPKPAPPPEPTVAVTVAAPITAPVETTVGAAGVVAVTDAPAPAPAPTPAETTAFNPLGPINPVRTAETPAKPEATPNARTA